MAYKNANLVELKELVGTRDSATKRKIPTPLATDPKEPRRRLYNSGSPNYKKSVFVDVKDILAIGPESPRPGPRVHVATILVLINGAPVEKTFVTREDARNGYNLFNEIEKAGGRLAKVETSEGPSRINPKAVENIEDSKLLFFITNGALITFNNKNKTEHYCPASAQDVRLSVYSENPHP